MSVVPNRGSPDPDTGKPLPLPFRTLGFMSGSKALQQEKSGLRAVRIESWLTHDSSVCTGRQAHPATQFHSNVTLLPNLHGPQLRQTAEASTCRLVSTLFPSREGIPISHRHCPLPPLSGGQSSSTTNRKLPQGRAVTADLVPINKRVQQHHTAGLFHLPL